MIVQSRYGCSKKLLKRHMISVNPRQNFSYYTGSTMSSRRPASHAGSWYADDGNELQKYVIFFAVLIS